MHPRGLIFFSSRLGRAKNPARGATAGPWCRESAGFATCYHLAPPQGEGNPSVPFAGADHHLRRRLLGGPPCEGPDVARGDRDGMSTGGTEMERKWPENVRLERKWPLPAEKTELR